jgi:hypothetical protein
MAQIQVLKLNLSQIQTIQNNYINSTKTDEEAKNLQLQGKKTFDYGLIIISAFITVGSVVRSR